MKVDMSGCGSSMEMLEGRDEFRGPETHLFCRKKAITHFYCL